MYIFHASGQITGFSGANENMERLIQNYRRVLRNNMNMDKELATYGVRLCIISALNIMTIIIIGLVFHSFGEGVVYTVCFISLRTVSGGYHSNSRTYCYIESLLMYTASLFLITRLYPHIYYMIVIVIIFACIRRFLPIDNENKALCMNEKKKYLKAVNYLYVIWFVVSIVLFGLQLYTYCMTIIVSIFDIHLLCIAGLLKNSVLIYKKEKMC